MLIRFSLLASLSLLLVASISDRLYAQRQLGVRWLVPEDTEQAIHDLELFRDLGITHLEVSKKLPDQVWQFIEKQKFTIFGSLPVPFPTAGTFTQPDSAFVKTLQQLVSHFIARERVRAIGLFQYGPANDERFVEELIPYVQQIREVYTGKLFYLSSKSKITAADELVDFKMVRIRTDGDPPRSEPMQLQSAKNTVYVYDPAPGLSGFLRPFKEALLTSSYISTPLFVDSEWLEQIISSHPDVQNTIKLHTSEPGAVFAAPREQLPVAQPYNLMVIILLCVWGGLALVSNLSPIFRKSLSRYFTGHRFFVEDVLQRHIRTMGPATVILIINAVLSGVVVYGLTHMLFSDLGIRALSYHFPLAMTGTNYPLSLALWGILAAFGIELACLIWLLLASTRTRHPAQVVNLYVWPLVINIFVATIMVTMLKAGVSHPALAIALGLIFLLVLLSTFVVTSFDLARYARQRHLYLFGTSMTYLALWSALIVWVVTNDHLSDVIRLARWLS